MPSPSRGCKRLAAVFQLSLNSPSLVVAIALAALPLALALPASGHGAYHDVVREVEKKLAKKPDDAALHYRLAEAHAGHEEWQLCLAAIETVERLEPGVFPTGFLRGWALDIAGKPQEARKALNEFLVTRPKYSRALAARGRVCLKLGESAAAAADFTQALELEPNHEPELVVELAAARATAKDSAGAIRALDEGIAKFGPLPTLLQPALEIETKSQDWDAALRRLDAMKAGAPRPEPWMARRAALLTSAGREEAARGAWTALRDHLQALPSLDRGTPENLRLLAEARRALGEQVLTPVAAPPAPVPAP